MKSDLYTKIILTVIAAALIGLLFKNTDVVATAQASDIPVQTPLTAREVIDVNVVSIGGESASLYTTSGKWSGSGLRVYLINK